MAELPMKDRGALARLTRLKLLVDLECAAQNTETAMRRGFIEYIDEQLAKIIAAYNPDDGDQKTPAN